MENNIEKKVDIKEFENCKTTSWDFGNNILYALCKKYSDHKDRDKIRAKIWLIGKSYSASIERRKNKKKDETNDKFYNRVVNEMFEFNRKIKLDKRLQQLKNKELNEENLKEILFIHKQLVDLFRKLTEQDKRSLASKYLHFHCNIFPIYDSIAEDTISRVLGVIDEEKRDYKNVDWEYAHFCYKFLILYNYLKNKGKKPTIRQIDNYLTT